MKEEKLIQKSAETWAAVEVLHFVFTEKINDTDFFLAKEEDEVRKVEMSWGDLASYNLSHSK